MASLDDEKACINASGWIKHYSDCYERDKYNVILDTPFVLEMFIHDNLLYLKDGNNYLYNPNNCQEIRHKITEIPLMWNPQSKTIEEVVYTDDD